MSDSYYKGYWMVTNRCNLRCSYCVLENAPHQIQAELDLNGKKELVSHLYHQLKFRQLTLSGGEVSIIGKHPPRDFVELLTHIRQFRSSDSKKNLGIELYTNGKYINEKVVDEMVGVVDRVAVTIDSVNPNLLTELGRKNKKDGLNQYYENIVEVCALLTRNNIEIKLHSVISQKNYLSLPEEVAFIVKSVEKAQGHISCWKFYQYMSYDMPERDKFHAIPMDLYKSFKARTEEALFHHKIRLHFKDNQEMNDSLFNILSYGNAQYMRAHDTWSTSQRTKDLRSYHSMSELFAAHDINESLFRHFHEICL